jgi:uncharacterized membrane protein YphA (DoxX/SURF4 family)
MSVTFTGDHMTHPSDRIATAASWIVGSLFIVSGLLKLFMVAPAVHMFEQFKLPVWSLIAVGLFEISSAGLLMTKRARSYGAIGLCATMLGAILAHVLTAIDQEMLLLDLVFFSVCVWLVMRDLPEFLRPDWDHDPHGHPDTGKHFRVVR